MINDMGVLKRKRDTKAVGRTTDQKKRGHDMNYTEAVALALAGDERGFGVLYEKTFKKAYKQAYMYMKNEHDAADVLQDAYIKAFERLDTVENPEKFPVWFQKIVWSTAMNALKKKNPLAFSDLVEEEDEEYEVEDDYVDFIPEMSYTREETRRFAHEMIDALPDSQRICIIMFHLEEKSIKEIAEELGCSENTVKSRLKYGRENIRAQGEVLQKKGYSLYGVAPLPFLLYLLRQEGVYLESDGFYTGLKASLAEKVVSTKGIQSSAGVSGGAGKAAVQGMKLAKTGFIHTTVGKITMAAVVSLSLIGGTGVAVHGILQQNMKESAMEAETSPKEEVSKKEEEEKEETLPTTEKEVQDTDYETLIAGNLTKEELQYVLAYGPQEIPEQGFQNRDYLDFLNAFCDAAGRNEGMIEYYGTNANWVPQYSVSDINRMFRSFTDYQLQEENNKLSEYHVQVSGDIVSFAPASTGKTANAVITSASYTEEEMEICYTYDYITTDMGREGIPKKVENKKAILNKNQDGQYQIIKIEIVESQTGEEMEVPETESSQEESAEAAGFPAGKYSYVAMAGGSRRSLTVEESGIATLVQWSSATGKGSEQTYQMSVDHTSAVPEGVTAYLLQSQDGAVSMTLYYNAEQGTLEDITNGFIWERVE